MARSTSASQKPTFLPAGMKRFLIKRAAETGGLALLLAAGFAALALVAYNPGDPNLNHATGAPVRNLMGLPGAYLADLLLQTFGVGAIVVVVVPTTWAWRIITHRGLPRFWFNLVLLPLALLVTASAAATLATPVDWPLELGLGGLVGAQVLDWQSRLVGMLGLPVAAWQSTLGLGLLAAAALAGTLGIGAAEWWSAGRRLARGVGRAALAAFRGSRAAVRLVGRLKRTQAAPGSSRSRRPEPRLAGTEAAAEIPPAPRAGNPNPKRVERPRAKPRAGTREETERQPALNFGQDGQFELPPLALLRAPGRADRVELATADALEQNAKMLESVLDDFGIRGEIIKVRPGPVVTLYELEPAPGTKSSRVIGLADDIARSMSAVSARVSVIPGRNAIGIELPNAARETVYLRELFASADYGKSTGRLVLALGKDIGGAAAFVELSRMPHLLIAGTTGSGKSVAVNIMILSLLYRLKPDQCRMIMIDPKMLELSVYDGIPHLLSPVVTDPKKAVVALKWAVREMENRYRKMSELGVRNIASYNQRVVDAQANGESLSRTVQTGFDAETGQAVFEDRPLDMEPLPLIVVIVDEMADLMMVAGKEIEGAIQRLAQMARAAGIHLIMATQRPSVDVITGTIKANFPTRISFQVTSKIDSRTILGEPGAEQLLGAGDMLYMAGAGRITRVHGPFVSDDEVEEVVAFLKRQGAPDYLNDVTDDREDSTLGVAGGVVDSGDRLFDQAVDLVARERKASTSFIQRHLQIGYNRAARIVERMETDGIIGPANHVGKREILVREVSEFD